MKLSQLQLSALQSRERPTVDDRAALIEAVARAICAADTTAPDPDAPILLAMRPAKAWEARIDMARSAIATHEEIMRRSWSR